MSECAGCRGKIPLNFTGCSTGTCLTCEDCVCPDCHRCKNNHCKCSEDSSEE